MGLQEAFQTFYKYEIAVSDPDKTPEWFLLKGDQAIGIRDTEMMEITMRGNRLGDLLSR